MVKEYTKRTRQLYNSKYWALNKDRLKESNLARVKAWTAAKTHEELAFIHLKKKAKASGVDFNISIDDVIIPDLCPILKIPFKRGRGPRKYNSVSVDRIDNTKGYIKGNIQVISVKANTMKNNASSEELLKFADWIYKNYKNN